MGQVRAPLLAAARECVLVAVVDPFEATGRALAERVGTSYFATLGAAVGAGGVAANCVWIATGTATHEALILESLALLPRLRAIFCEKPVDSEPGKIRELFAECAAHGVRLCCGFQRRFDPSYVAAREKVAAGLVGHPSLVRVFFADHPCPPMEFLRAGGCPFMDLAPHDVDFVSWCLDGDHPVEVSASGSSSTGELRDAGVLDNAMISMRYSKGALVNIMMSRGASYGYDQRCELFGERGIVSVGNVRQHECVLSTAEGSRAARLQHSFPERFGEAFANEVAAWVAVVVSGAAWPVSERDCVAAQEICMAAAEAQRQGRLLPYTRGRLRLRPVGRGAFGTYATALMRESQRAEVLAPYSRSVAGMSWSASVVGDDSVEAVYVCSPDREHLAHATAVLGAGKHCLVEKPITPSFAALAALAAHPRAPVLMVGFHRRFAAEFLRARAWTAARQGGAAPVTRVRVVSRDPVVPDPDLAFVLFNSLSHDVDMLLWLFEGAKLRLDEARTERGTSAVELRATLAWPGGRVVAAEVSYAKCAPSYVQRVELTDASGETRVFAMPEWTAQDGDANMCSVYRQAYLAQFSAFVDLCRGGDRDRAHRIAGYAHVFETLSDIVGHPAFR
jgi:myo-inositol 2-dehydrogenase/D-chiro-inositol 1-dehydrogenase